MIVYADIYILINFVCNLAALLLCASLTSSKKKYGRFVLVSFFMAAYSFFALVWELNSFFRIPLDALVLVCAMRMSFGKMKIPLMVRQTCVFLTSCIATGGIAGMLYGASPIRAAVILFVAPSVYLMWYMSVRIMQYSRKFVSVVIDGQKLSGLKDSGNVLYDRQRGVHIIVANSERLCIGDEKIAGFIKTETVCGTGYMPYYYPDRVEIDGRAVCAAVALNKGAKSGFDCIVPIELT